MNRFRTKKKNKEEISAVRPSMESESSGPFRMFGKKKSQDDEPKKELDLTSALPPSDDFRTSLLMTGLSARFSMLREQDDPKSKLGKASDDSVLFPKRQSRMMMDFGQGGGLHDIAEIESLRSPPFARFDSYHSSDDAASTTGSIMNRAKPTDGNNLFGGRQKIYKIPVGGNPKAGSMGGRALYDDDVAHSAFQKWRQAERDRNPLEDDETNDTIQSEPQFDYNHRRETNSTTSSAPSVARNSTAATSVTSSQPASSIKDWQSTTGAITSSASHLPLLERSVTRTRRLYEQGLTQDLQDQQSSALSRMDTLSRQRPFGARTPDLTPPIPSPTSTSFGDRALERRPIMGKASAPNLRSFSPATTSSTQISPAESNSKFPGPEQKPNFGASPPLSPPISETEDHPMLPIQPNDRGKATAMGVFNRPPQQYDESKYAQRQRQLQQGRDTPISQVPSESDSSTQGVRSRSSSAQRTPLERNLPSVTTPELVAHQDGPIPTFFDESDDASVDNQPRIPAITPLLTIERPDDQDHPAFRKSALPTPLSLSSSRPSDDHTALSVNTVKTTEPLGDSPTLGPDSGLSGMVRQHLRHDSNASSIYGASDQEATPGSASTGGDNGPEEPERSTQPHGATPKEQDEFARHLADGARRVRERLTTYVESDNERSAPTTPLSETKQDLGATRANGLGILQSKSSRGSLFDSASRDRSRSKSAKGRKPLPSNAAAPSSPGKPPASPSEDMRDDGQRQGEESSEEKEFQSGDKDENVHAGLKAFRQARRELQRMKELEIQQRHHTAQKPTGPPERPPQRITPHDNGPPPAMFNRMPRDESRNSSRSRAGSRAASERDRSGSETSTGGQAYGRGPRLRNGSATYEDPYGHGAGGFGRPNPNMRVIGLQGMETKHSPIMPPHASPITLPTGMMSPSHSTGAIDPSSRRMGRKRDVSDQTFGSPVLQGPSSPHDGQPYSRSRNGSLLGAAVSTPNLHSTMVAPPLPPINPRRKNGHGGFVHRGEEGTPVGSHRMPPGVSEDVYGGTVSDDEGGLDMYRQGVRRMTSDAHGRMRHSPPRGTVRPPLPHANMSNGNLPGGMI
ncbi:hypothetical protein TOPH_04674 [Tolypocladium ophioglossoides CBS 100239]|uniref:Uncharacterized protein n=1 Tax=Tolypocladium ophioglossoides (strain CBS 100239) TaxID=1163406 RepID=A0A0L0NA25_TOLOC|nr:hypothetical protein TOPH_04674 [Tolypocladium ophioglossoides CBS 100239]